MARGRDFFVALIVTAMGPGRLAAQAYGIGDQSVVIGAASFVGQNLGHQGNIGFDGYLYQPNFQSTFSAPVTLPDGALIKQICMYSVNFKQGATLQLQLETVQLAEATAPAVVPIPGTAVTAGFIGYNFACTGPLAYTFHEYTEVTGNQHPEPIAHRVSVAFTPLDETLGLGGVRILWHRQISLPPLAATFGDVPPSHLFFQHVEALASSAITGGCSGGNYCPDSPLTRGQMAVFLAKALGLHWPF